jgi:hypothetical protein
MARGINKRVIYLFVLTRNLKSEDPEDLINVEPLTIENAYDYLNPESYKICNSYGGKFGDGECFFKKVIQCFNRLFFIFICFFNLWIL